MTAATMPHPARGIGQPLACAILAMVAIQLAAALSRPLVAEIGAPAVTWLRMTAAGIALLVVTRPKLRGLPRRAFGAALMLGGALAIMACAYFAAVSRLPLGVVATIAFLGPLSLGVLGSRGWKPTALALLAGTGVALAVMPLPSAADTGSVLDPVGIVLALIAAVGFALYILLTRRVGMLFHGSDGLTISLLTAALLLAPFGLAGIDHAPGLPVILGSASLAILAPLLTCRLEMSALRTLGTQCFSILISLEPAIAAALGLVVLHEVPSPLQATGMICVILASVGTVRLTSRSASTWSCTKARPDYSKP